MSKLHILHDFKEIYRGHCVVEVTAKKNLPSGRIEGIILPNGLLQLKGDFVIYKCDCGEADGKPLETA